MDDLFSMKSAGVEEVGNDRVVAHFTTLSASLRGFLDKASSLPNQAKAALSAAAGALDNAAAAIEEHSIDVVTGRPR